MPNSYILNKVNFQQKKEKKFKFKLNYTKMWKKKSKLNNILNVKKKDWKEKKGTFQKTQHVYYQV